MAFQVARVRLHGFSEREISIVRALMMSEIESAYLERDQMQSTSLRDEYLQVIQITFSILFTFLLFFTALNCTPVLSIINCIIWEKVSFHVTHAF